MPLPLPSPWRPQNNPRGVTRARERGGEFAEAAEQTSKGIDWLPTERLADLRIFQSLLVLFRVHVQLVEQPIARFLMNAYSANRSYST